MVGGDTGYSLVSLSTVAARVQNLSINISITKNMLERLFDILLDGLFSLKLMSEWVNLNNMRPRLIK